MESREREGKAFFGAKNQRYFDSIMDTFQIKNLTCVDPKTTVTEFHGNLFVP